MVDVRGQVVLVTGAAQGIGRATAAAFVDAGAKVVLTDRDRDRVEAAGAALGGSPVRGLDVTDAAAFEACVEDVEAHVGPIDVLVNNAGIMTIGPFLEQPAHHDERMLDVNVRGVLNGMRAVLPRMKGRGRGAVINVASMAGKVPTPYGAVYSATKHAVVALTEAVRFELDATGVHLGYVCPIPVRTQLIAGVKDLQWPPPVEPEAVAAAILDAVRNRRIEVFVPRSQRLIAAMPSLLPRRVLEGIAAKLGVDRLFRDADHAARADYEDRSTRHRG
ncbi:MAG: SDR family oxidoreductase [Deltaproteobacteria bacterium]